MITTQLWLPASAYLHMVRHALNCANIEGVGSGGGLVRGVESCGLLVQSNEGAVARYMISRNVSPRPANSFVIDEPLYAHVVAERMNLIAVVHSHPRGDGELSGMDREAYVPVGVGQIVVGLAGGQPAVGAFFNGERASLQVV